MHPVDYLVFTVISHLQINTIQTDLLIATIDLEFFTHKVNGLKSQLNPHQMVLYPNHLQIRWRNATTYYICEDMLTRKC